MMGLEAGPQAGHLILFLIAAIAICRVASHFREIHRKSMRAYRYSYWIVREERK